MRVLLLYSTKNLGGAEVYALGLVTALRNNVEYIVSGPYDSFLTREAHRLSVDTVEVPISYPESAASSLVCAFHLLQNNCRCSDIDVVHAHHLPAAVVGEMIASAYGIPLLFSIDSAPIRDSYLRFVQSFPCYVLTASKDAYDALASSAVSKGRMFWVRPGIDVKQFPIVNSEIRKESRAAFGVDGNTNVIGTAARLVKDKGVQYVIEAMHHVFVESGMGVELLIAGEGSMEQQLRDLADRMGIENQTRFLGELAPNDMPAFYGCLDVFILASLREGTPLVLMEAMSSGIPMVATNVGDASSMIVPGRNGFLVNIQNSGEIADRVVQILKQRRFKSHALCYNVKMREQFDYSVRTQEVLGLYKSIADSAWLRLDLTLWNHD